MFYHHGTKLDFPKREARSSDGSHRGAEFCYPQISQIGTDFRYGVGRFWDCGLRGWYGFWRTSGQVQASSSFCLPMAIGSLVAN